MVKTKKHYGFPVSVVYILVLFSTICIIIGCSSKKDETNSKKSPSAKTEVNTPSADKEHRVPELPTLPSPEANQAANTPQIIKEVDTVEIEEPCEVAVSTDTLLKELTRTSDSDKKVEILRSMFDRASDQDPCVIKIVQKEVAEKDGNVALAAIELLQGYESPQVLPAIAKAMAHPDEDVRLTAVNLLLDINDPQTGDLLAAALSDKSEDIRSTALDEIKYKDTQVQFKVLETAISSSHSDVKEDSIFMLQYIGGPRAVDILIEALRDKDPEFRETVTSAISALIDKDFESYKEAKSWWEKNKNKYDEDLILTEEQQETQKN